MLDSFSFTIEQLRLLAEAERLMDEGKMPFVILRGERVSVQPEVMEELGLKQGQTINLSIFLAICEQFTALCQASIAIQKAQATQVSR
jgi:hypothetical protein